MAQPEDGALSNESLFHTLVVGWIMIHPNVEKFGSEVQSHTDPESGRVQLAASYQELVIIIELKFNQDAEILHYSK
ncbi:hypothetical protein TNCV_791951 [Trichonephila clavipes]|nr:hypothetical protein TNCV_791951 [Trichonephila clavipes]